MRRNADHNWLRSISRVAQLGTLLALGILCSTQASAQGKHHFANLSLFYPVTTNTDVNGSANLRLNLIYGRLGTIRGLDINGIASYLQQDLRGIQVTGIYSEVRGEFRGLALTGGINKFGTSSRGLQFAGLVNFDLGEFKGLQYATLLNFVEDDFVGLQLTPVVNIADLGGKGLQIAGVGNASGEQFSGLQIATFANFANEGFSGVQIGGGNVASRATGIQAGIANFSSVMRGVQIGFLNIVGRHEGVPIGVINVSEENGGADWITFGSSLSLYNTGVRTTVNNWYSILYVGGDDSRTSENETFFIGWNWGRKFPLSEKFSFGADAGFVSISPQGRESGFGLQARVLAEFRTSHKFSIFAGGGTSTTFSSYSSSATSETDPLGVVGVTLF